jgi:hypothetical protein
MSYYPHIPWLEASQSIVNNLEGIPRWNMEMEDRAKKNRLYDLQERKLQFEMDEAENNREVGRSLYDTLQSKSADFEPQVTEVRTPDPNFDIVGDTGTTGESIYRLVTPPRQSKSKVIADQLFRAGRYKEAVQMMREDRLLEAEDMKSFQQNMDTVFKMAEQFPSAANNLLKILGEKDDRYARIGKLGTDETSRIKVMDVDLGENRIAKVITDGKGKFQVIQPEKDKEIKITSKAAAAALANNPEATAEEQKWGRMVFDELDKSDQRAAPKEKDWRDKLSGINAARKRKGIPLMDEEEFMNKFGKPGIMGFYNPEEGEGGGGESKKTNPKRDQEIFQDVKKATSTSEAVTILQKKYGISRDAAIKYLQANRNKF